MNVIRLKCLRDEQVTVGTNFMDFAHMGLEKGNYILEVKFFKFPFICLLLIPTIRYTLFKTN